MNKMLVAPSILSADFLNLGKEIEMVENSGCDFLHIDVMDGHFVPNLTIGPVVVESLSKVAKVGLDIHLMVENNRFFVELFAPMKPSFLSFHLEEEKHPHRLVQIIREFGIKPAIAINPHTNIQNLEYLLPSLDMVLIMSVNPGFSGQKFIDTTIKKVRELKELKDRINPSCIIEVDGGVNDKNISSLKEAGVSMVVAGNFVFKSNDYKKAIDSLKV